MTLIETDSANPQLGPTSPGFTGGPRWVLPVSHQLRRCDSVSAVMAAVTELAPRVTGCRQASLIPVLPSDRAKTGSTERLIALACVAARATVVSGGASRPKWQAALNGLAEIRSEQPSEDVELAFFMPQGAGRHPAALVLAFDPADSPPSCQLVTCQAFAELADTAAACQHAEDQVDSLLAALESSREIGTAIGILMATKHVGDDEAFAILREMSQRTHRKINVIAAEVVYTGMLPA